MLESDDVNYYNTLVSEIGRLGGNVHDPDDIADAIVELTYDQAHFTDEELDDAVAYFQLVQRCL